jgi:oxygen-dependent protoporphyrinogen oxidase
VYAGDPEQLSVRAAFPKLYALEEKYGALITGMIRGARERKRRAEKAKDRAKMFSFARGMQTFPDAIARMLGPSLRFGCDVTSITRTGHDGGSPNAFVVSYHKDGRSHAADVDAVVLAIPAHAAARYAGTLRPSIVPLLQRIYYPPVAEVFLGFTAGEIRRPLDGFGYLIPARERRNILGTIWSSALFPERAPSGHVALTTFVGGSRQPGLLERSDRELEELVLAEIRSIMGGVGNPVYRKIVRWDKAIPQYNLGYHLVDDAIARCESEVPGLFFCSNFRGGIAVGDCVMSGRRIASRVVSSVAGSREASLHSISEGA